MTPSMQRFVITTTMPLLAIVAAIYVVASWFGPQYEWRQKLTVTIDTPNGVKSGSAVTEVKIYHNRIFKDGAEWQRYLSGEATVVDLGGGSFLFALLETPADQNFMDRLAQNVIFDVNTPSTGEEMFQRITNTRGILDVPANRYPMLVTFENLNKPESVVEVRTENISKVLGQSYAIRAITLEIVHDDVTVGIVDRVLAWIKSHRGRIKPIKEPSPTGYTPTAVEQIYTESFYKGVDQ